MTSVTHLASAIVHDDKLSVAGHGRAFHLHAKLQVLELEVKDRVVVALGRHKDFIVSRDLGEREGRARARGEVQRCVVQLRVDAQAEGRVERQRVAARRLLVDGLNHKDVARDRSLDERRRRNGIRLGVARVLLAHVYGKHTSGLDSDWQGGEEAEAGKSRAASQ